MNDSAFKRFSLQLGKQSLRAAMSGFIRTVLLMKNIADRRQINSKTRGGPTRIVIRATAEMIKVKILKRPDIPIALR